MVFKLFKYLLFLSLSSTLTLLLCEGVLRVFDPIGIEYVFEAKRYFKYMERNDTYAYKHKPHLNEVFQGVVVRTNAEGLRGADFSIQKKRHSKRILVLGDSVVFGWGAREEHTLGPKLSQIARSSNLNQAIEFISAGVGSWNTRTEAEWFRARGLSYAPDMVVLVVVPNDISPKSRGNTFVSRTKLQLQNTRAAGSFFSSPPKWYRQLVESSYLLSSFQRLMTVRQMSEKMLAQFSSFYFQQETSQAIELLVQSCKQAGIPLYVFLFGEQQSPIGKMYYNFYKTEFTKHDVSTHSFPENLYSQRNRNSLIDSHPNKHGLNIMSQFIFSKIKLRLSNLNLQNSEANS